MLRLSVTIAAVAFLATAAMAQTADDARGFLQRLYQPYVTGNAPAPTDKIAPTLFAPELLALIRRDQQIANGEVGILESDPICNCQDYKIREVVVSPVQVTGDHAQASVSFKNFKDRFTMRYDLVKIDGKWRIADIGDKDTPSLKTFLETELAKLK